METIAALPPVLTAIAGLLLLGWVLLLLLVPFMIEGIRSWTRRNNDELRALNEKFDRLEAVLRGESRPPAPRSASPPRNPPGAPEARRDAPKPAPRKEPTLSEIPLDNGNDPRRRSHP
jgi:hypothetical protein